MFVCCKNDSSVINLIYTGELLFSYMSGCRWKSFDNLVYYFWVWAPQQYERMFH